MRWTNVKLRDTTSYAPGPGEYAQLDPNAPTVASNLKATRGKASGAFASGALRDADDWVELALANRR